MGKMSDMLPKVRAYLQSRDWSDVPVMNGRSFRVDPLAQGEYNLNYLISSDGGKFVFRVNIGTQINREDQAAYEYRTLALLQNSGVTPQPYFIDDSRTFFNRDILIMAYLPGEPLDYRRDLEAAAGLFAKIHQVKVMEIDNHLIREDAPLSLIYKECARLLTTYFESDIAHSDIGVYLKDVLAWADNQRVTERFYQEDPWPCIVNTEVNSKNFIVNRRRSSIHLVDWEMPRWGDPAQDLSHFCSPLTTLWKSNYRMTSESRRKFIRDYAKRMPDRHLQDTLDERVRLRDPFVYLRGISWSAMGWVAYQTEFDGVKNADTWATLERYMDLGFIRSLFDPFLKR